MKKQNLSAFNVIGISVRTTNQNDQVMTDLPALWQTFMANGIKEQIPNKIGEDIYCLYTNYVSDHSEPYTAILGCRVSSVDEVPENMVAINIDPGTFVKFPAKGNLMEGAVAKAWYDIWSTNLDRDFRVDFELYDERSANPEDAEIDIFVGVRN